MEKQNNKIKNNEVDDDDEDITDQMIAAIEADKAESGN
jgi:hypothetical protein